MSDFTGMTLTVTAAGSDASATVTTTYFGGLDRSTLVPFYCHQCRAWYVKVNTMMNCCVSHGGSCCHFQDEPCAAPDWDSPLARVAWGDNG